MFANGIVCITSPEWGCHDVAQSYQELSASCKHIRHRLHDANNSSTDGIFVRVHEGLEVLAPCDDSQKC